MSSTNNNYINLSERLLPGPRTELPGPVPGQARVWLRHARYVSRHFKFCCIATGLVNRLSLEPGPQYVAMYPRRGTLSAA